MNYLDRHEKILRELVGKVNFRAPRLEEATLYSLFSGGKRLRPALIYHAGAIADAPIESLDILAVAVEMIHCYSLIHDDLPAMDNDDFRRGMPTCHRQFDEATAILAGDGLQSLAFEILAQYLPATLPAERILQIFYVLSTATGFSGMTSGQSLDLTELQQPTVSELKLKSIHQLKTGALFKACITMALLAGNPNEMTQNALLQYGEYLGLIFQIQNDYQDFYEREYLGKARSSDKDNQKITFSDLYPKEDLIALMKDYSQKMEGPLQALGEKASALIDWTRVIFAKTFAP